MANLDGVRVLLRIAWRNLLASPWRTALLGFIVLLGSVVVVVGTSLLDSIDRGMRTSIQGSLGGHLQVYEARSEGDLQLYGGLFGEAILEPIEDFARVKEALSKVPNVKQVVPMGIDQAMVATGTTFDAALERLREDVRRMEAGDESAGRRKSYDAHRAHVRRMIDLLVGDIQQARAIADENSREIASRREEFEALFRTRDEAFWRDFDRDPYAGLEYLENRVAPSAMEASFTFLRYVGTDPDAFFRAFPLAEVTQGQMIPTGHRGILVGQQFAEEWLKIKNARRLDQIKDKRDRRGKRIAKDEELQRWVRDNGQGIKEILLQLDPLQAEALAADLRKALGAPPGQTLAPADLEALLATVFATTDQDFDAKYRIFYDVVAPRIRLYKIQVGDTITVKAPSKSGYYSSVNVKVYGFLRFKGIEKSGIAGMMSVMDLMSFRDLYGFVTKEKAEEIRALKAQMAAREVSRDEAEAALFGSAAPEAPAQTQTRQARIDERALIGGAARSAGAQDLSTRVYGQDELDHGVALNAALILDDPRQLRRTAKDVEAAAKAAGLDLKVVDWQTASGMIGQFVNMISVALLFGLAIFFGIALVVINNAMVMATLQRVKEIGTMRAMGAQRRFVVVMLLAEIGAVGVLFGLAGAALGGLVVALIRWLGGIPATTDMLYFFFCGPALLPHLGTASVVASLVAVVLVAVLSGLYPAWLAMKVTPVEAMSTED